MKNVKLLITISGTRNGADWPPAGSVVALPTDEADGLIASGSAVEATEEDGAPVDTEEDGAPVEFATPPAPVETADVKTGKR